MKLERKAKQTFTANWAFGEGEPCMYGMSCDSHGEVTFGMIENDFRRSSNNFHQPMPLKYNQNEIKRLRLTIQ